MLLSLCIPTYNRCAFIRVSARSWLEQLKPLADRVELIIADNASGDETVSVLESYQKICAFQLIRRPRTLTFNESTHDLVTARAQGQYVWVCGDDDYPEPNALREVVAALEAHPGQDHFYITTQFIPHDHAPDVAKEDPRRSAYVHRPAAVSSGIVRETKEILRMEGGGFSGFYSSIFRRELAGEALSGDFCRNAPFTSLEATLPYSVYIARHRLTQPCYRIGEPLLTVVHSISWPQYASLFRLKTLPDLYDLYAANGVDPQVLQKHREELLDHWPRNFIDLFRRRHQQPRQPFSFPGFLLRYSVRGRFWKELFRAIWCDLLP
jgi:glycosyltransferase involved in cell wall biosynthesis